MAMVHVRNCFVVFFLFAIKKVKNSLVRKIFGFFLLFKGQEVRLSILRKIKIERKKNK